MDCGTAAGVGGTFCLPVSLLGPQGWPHGALRRCSQSGFGSCWWQVGSICCEPGLGMSSSAQKPWWVFRAGPCVWSSSRSGGGCSPGVPAWAVAGWLRLTRLAGCAHTSGLRVTCYCRRHLKGGNRGREAPKGRARATAKKASSQDRSNYLYSLSEDYKLKYLQAP